MDFIQIIILAIVQGAAELLPVSSSAHVIIAEKLMGLDPSSPQMTLLLVLLHTGTMFAVILYFWKNWKSAYFESAQARKESFLFIAFATVATGAVGLTMQFAIKKLFAGNSDSFEIEQLFGNTKLMSAALAAAGLLIIASTRLPEKKGGSISMTSAILIGAVQGLCLPFRGFSRSGATISTAVVLGSSRRKAEEFSFALAVVLTPAVIAKEGLRLLSHQQKTASSSQLDVLHMLTPGLIGMLFSFLAGLLALRWLSSWLEGGRWHLFGIYCLFVSAFVFWLG